MMVLYALVAVAVGWTLGSLVDWDRGSDDAENDDMLPETDDDMASEPLMPPADPLQGTPGDDLLQGRIEGGIVAGGDGADEIDITSRGGGVTLLGEDGDDDIRLRSGAGPQNTIDGGAGNDIIDARGLESVDIYGGSGDDLIRFNGAALTGAAFAINVDAGDGNDTLRYVGTANDPEFFAPIEAFGGAGEDLFEVRFSEGTVPITDPTAQTPVLDIGDFDPTEDSLIIRPDVDDDSYTVTSARLEPNADADETALILRYESDTNDDRMLVITINGTGLDWDDIQFTGPHQPVALIPV